MLKTHMDAREQVLLAVSKVPATSGHPLHKGTPREAFIKEFLANHLSERLAVGSGEIIDASSKPGEARSQMDIVLYKRDYPKLDFGGEINGFLVESVVATIEVKSLLDEREFHRSYLAARRLKSLKKSLITTISSGYQPPSILSYVVAYDGPASMNTVYGWVGKLHDAQSIEATGMGDTEEERLAAVCPGLDGTFVLGKGFIYFDNTPFGFLWGEKRKQNPGTRWVSADSSRGNLMLLFLFLTVAVSGMAASWLDPLPYLSGFSANGLAFRP
jgi:hypothetical protein